jgi:hypothetical protein
MTHGSIDDGATEGWGEGATGERRGVHPVNRRSINEGWARRRFRLLITH